MGKKKSCATAEDQRRAELCFRYAIVSTVLTKIERGEVRQEVVAEAAAETHATPTGPRLVSSRTIYRWLANYVADALAGLEPPTRSSSVTSRALPEKFEKLLVEEKTKDPEASIPEVIRRAVEQGVLPSVDAVDRSTVHRAARRRGLPVARGRRQVGAGGDKQRFAHAHRMQVVLCDGKHLRVGPDRLRRVALIFLDDCTRFALGGAVVTSESCEAFLASFYDVLCTYGSMRVMYFDHGPGFSALDTQQVLAQLKIRFVHGPAGYKEGRGKIERAIRTFKADLLRHWGTTATETDCGALTLALNHYLGQVYNLRAHASLGHDRSPHAAFYADTRPFDLPASRETLRAKFVIRCTRTVSADRVLSYDGVLYETPVGYARSEVEIHRRVLTGGVWMDHEGQPIELHPVDVTANAHAKRARGQPRAEAPVPQSRSAAQRHFDRDHPPLVDADGGFAGPADEDRPGGLELK